MTVEKLRELKVGDRVQHVDGPIGEVTHTGYMGIVVRWEDGPCRGYFYSEQDQNIYDLRAIR